MPLLASPGRLLVGAVRHPSRAAAVATSRVRLRGSSWTPAGSRSLVEAADAERPGRTIEAACERVLHVVTNALPFVQAGYTVRTHELVSAQRALGLDAEVVTRWGWPSEQGILGAADADSVGSVTYRRLTPAARVIPTDPAVRIRLFADALEQLVRRRRPALLHAATDHPNGAAAYAVARRTGLPFVYELRGLVEESRAARGEGPVDDEARAVETMLMRRADAVIVLGEGMRAEAVGRGVDPARITVVPNGVDPTVLTARADGALFRAEHRIGQRERVVGSVSTLHTYEGFDVLLRAVAQLRREGFAVRPLLVGDGPARPSLEALASDLGLSDAVFTGRVARELAVDAFAALDVMAVPRVDHRVCRLVTPLKPVEAMALGIPVVASDLPALRELTDDGRVAVHVRAGSVRDLAGALRNVLSDDATTRALANDARTHVTDRRTWTQSARRTRDVYAGVAPAL